MPPLTAKICQKSRKKSGKDWEKIREESGKKRKYRELKAKIREVSFTLPLLTDRAGYPSQHPQLGPMWVPAGDAGIELGMGYPRWVPCGLFMGCPYMGFKRVYPHGSHMGCMWVSHGGLAHMGPIWDECGLL